MNQNWITNGSNWSGLTTQSNIQDMWKTPGYKMKKSDVIKAKCNILKKLELDIRTNIDIKELCRLFLSDYDLYKWKCDDIESLVNVVRDLLNSNNEEDLIIVVEILKNLERK